MAGDLASGSSSPLSSICDSSSILTEYSRSPTPPDHVYPTPPSSQLSPYSSPSPERSMLDGCERPAKRRRLDPSVALNPAHLEVQDFTNPLSAEHGEQVTRLFKALRNRRKIVVIAGAGISVSAGIPDFRSSSGLFKSLKKEHNLKGSGKDLFDSSVYNDADAITSFHQMVRTLSQQTRAAKPTPFHHFLARLAREGRLQRLYTQNVDGIDTSLGPLRTEVPLPVKGPWPRTVQLHGGLEKMTCIKCKHMSDFQPELFDGPVPPECGSCKEKDYERTQLEGKRSHGVGTLRPRMVLYNEHGPDDEAIGRVTRADLKTRPDCVIVVGTSLKVPGVRRIVREMCATVNDRRNGLTIWINNDPVPSGKDLEDAFDLVVLGPCDKIAEHANLGNWDDDEMSPSDVVTEEELAKAKSKGCAKVVVAGKQKLPAKRRLSGNKAARLSLSLTVPLDRPLTYAGPHSPITPAFEFVEDEVMRDIPELQLPSMARPAEYKFAEHWSEASFSSGDELHEDAKGGYSIDENTRAVTPKATTKPKAQATLVLRAPSATKTKTKQTTKAPKKPGRPRKGAAAKKAAPKQANLAITSMLPVSKSAAVAPTLVPATKKGKPPASEYVFSADAPKVGLGQSLNPVSPVDARNNYSPPQSAVQQLQLLQGGEQGRKHEINLPRIPQLDEKPSISPPPSSSSQSSSTFTNLVHKCWNWNSRTDVEKA